MCIRKKYPISRKGGISSDRLSRLDVLLVMAKLCGLRACLMQESAKTSHAFMKKWLMGPTEILTLPAMAESGREEDWFLQAVGSHHAEYPPLYLCLTILSGQHGWPQILTEAAIHICLPQPGGGRIGILLVG